MPKHKIELTGLRFERLLVTGFAGRSVSGQYMWDCVCDCGAKRRINGVNLRSGMTKSCGCYSRDATRARPSATRIHGLSKTGAYQTWRSMLNRCYRKDAHAYERYGGRGIRVCDRWKDDFMAFYADMGDRPIGMTIERNNNDGNYEPGNCRWATRREQMNNTHRNRRVDSGQTVAQLSDETGIPRATIVGRLNRGLPHDEGRRRAERRAVVNETRSDDDHIDYAEVEYARAYVAGRTHDI